MFIFIEIIALYLKEIKKNLGFIYYWQVGYCYLRFWHQESVASIRLCPRARFKILTMLENRPNIKLRRVPKFTIILYFGMGRSLKFG